MYVCIYTHTCRDDEAGDLPPFVDHFPFVQVCYTYE